MLPIALLALLSAATLTALLHDGPDGNGTEDAAGPETETETETPETDPAALIEVTPGTTVNGGTDSEGFEITRQVGGVGDPVTINAGAGATPSRQPPSPGTSMSPKTLSSQPSTAVQATI